MKGAPLVELQKSHQVEGSPVVVWSSQCRKLGVKAKLASPFVSLSVVVEDHVARVCKVLPRTTHFFPIASPVLPELTFVVGDREHAAFGEQHHVGELEE